MILARSFAALSAAALLSLSACGDSGGTLTKGKIELSQPAETTSPGVVSPDTKPGDFPEYGEQNYTYVYSIGCFCAYVGKVRVVVEDGEVTEAELLDKTRFPGGAAPEWARLTINDLIAEANEAGGKVDFKWPEGQGYPDSLSIDRIPQAVDDEVGYRILKVEVQ